MGNPKTAIWYVFDDVSTKSPTIGLAKINEIKRMKIDEITMNKIQIL